MRLLFLLLAAFHEGTQQGIYKGVQGVVFIEKYTVRPLYLFCRGSRAPLEALRYRSAPDSPDYPPTVLMALQISAGLSFVEKPDRSRQSITAFPPLTLPAVVPELLIVLPHSGCLSQKKPLIRVSYRSNDRNCWISVWYALIVAALLFLPAKALRNVASPFSRVMVRMSAPVFVMSPLLSHIDRKGARAGHLSKLIPIT